MKKIAAVLALVLVLALVGALTYKSGIFTGAGLTIVSIDEVNVVGDKAYWISAVNVDDVGEKLIHTYRIGSNVVEQVAEDGNTVIQPRTSFDLTLEATENYCEYAVTRKTLEVLGDDFEYGAMSSPTREVKYRAMVSKSGESRLLSAYDRSTQVFNDKDGKGMLTLKSAGTLQGQSPCPELQEVVVCETDDNRVHFIKKSFIEAYSPIINFADACQEAYDTRDGLYRADSYTTQFKTYSVADTYFKGVMPDNSVGTALVTVNADSDMFDSVLYQPAVQVDPIVRFDVPSLVVGQQSTMLVEVANKANNYGKVQVVPSSAGLTFTPTKDEEMLRTKVTSSFLVAVPSAPLKTEICVEACSVGSQLVESKCHKICKEAVVSSSGTVTCGDGTCDPTKGENYVTCAVDCPFKVNCDDLLNSHLDTQTSSCVCDEGFTLKLVDDKQACVEDFDYVFWAFVAVVVVVLVGLAVYLFGDTRGGLR